MLDWSVSDDVQFGSWEVSDYHVVSCILELVAPLNLHFYQSYDQLIPMENHYKLKTTDCMWLGSRLVRT
jgi:hypothetical protein